MDSQPYLMAMEKSCKLPDSGKIPLKIKIGYFSLNMRTILFCNILIEKSTRTDGNNEF